MIDIATLWIWLAGATAVSGIAYLIATRDRSRHRIVAMGVSGETTPSPLGAQNAEVVERQSERLDTSDRPARGDAAGAVRKNVPDTREGATGRFISAPLLEPRSSVQPKPPRRSGSR